MRRSKGGGDEGGGDSWMNTYADMVTLLLTFFAVLLSMSNTNEEKFNAFIQSFSNLPPEQIEEIINKAGDNPEPVDDATAPTPEEVAQAMDELFQNLSDYVTTNGMQDAVSLKKIDNVIYITFDSSVFFEPNKYVLRQDSVGTISFIGDGIKGNEKMINLIAICGHTATVGDSNEKVNDWMLSSERAAVVGMYLEDQKGIDPKKMRTLGFGKHFPVADNGTEEGRKKNRRVELALVGEGSEMNLNSLSQLGEISKDSEEIITPESPGVSPAPSASPTASPSATSSPAVSSPTVSPVATPKPTDVEQGVSPYG